MSTLTPICAMPTAATVIGERRVAELRRLGRVLNAADGFLETLSAWVGTELTCDSPQISEVPLSVTDAATLMQRVVVPSRPAYGLIPVPGPVPTRAVRRTRFVRVGPVVVAECIALVLPSRAPYGATSSPVPLGTLIHQAGGRRVSLDEARLLAVTPTDDPDVAVLATQAVLVNGTGAPVAVCREYVFAAVFDDVCGDRR